MGAKPSTKGGKDEGAAYGKEKLGKGYESGGTLESALSGALACAARDPLVKLCPRED